MPALNPPQYVARRPLKIGDKMRMPGEPIPEAASWRNLRAYLNRGDVELLEEAPPVASASSRAQAQAQAPASSPEPRPPPPSPGAPKTLGKMRR